MTNYVNRHWVKASTPEGAVRTSDFAFRETLVPPLKDGEFLVETHYLSTAPVMRRYLIDGAGIEKPLEVGDTMYGRGVGEVIESNNINWPKGTLVQGKLGWQSHAVIGPNPELMYPITQRVVPISTGLGILGMTGFTAYCALKDIGKPQEGETVLVSGAMGGVGSIAVQVARLMGCRVIGIAGGDEKCAILRDELGCDAAINYKSDPALSSLVDVASDGVDIFFDNVGGPILDAALTHINRYARIISCGRISEYLLDEPYALKNWSAIGANRATFKGFFVYDYENMFAEAEQVMAGWAASGDLKYQEDILEGIEQMPTALMRLYEGKNVGKQIVKVK